MNYKIIPTMAMAVCVFGAPPVPRPAADFAIPMPDGSKKLLSGYKGKVVCLEFVSTDCPHCQHASQVMSKLYSEYGAKGFQPLAVAFNDGAKDAVAGFVASNHVNYPVGYSERDPVLKYLQVSLLERLMVPQMLWIDRKGVVRAQTPQGGDESMLEESYYRSEIEKLLAESGGPKRRAH